MAGTAASFTRRYNSEIVQPVVEDRRQRDPQPALPVQLSRHTQDTECAKETSFDPAPWRDEQQRIHIWVPPPGGADQVDRAGAGPAGHLPRPHRLVPERGAHHQGPVGSVRHTPGPVQNHPHHLPTQPKLQVPLHRGDQ